MKPKEQNAKILGPIGKNTWLGTGTIRFIFGGKIIYSKEIKSGGLLN